MVVVLVPPGNMTSMKYAAASATSLCNRSNRVVVTNSRIHLQFRNGICYGKRQIGIGGCWSKSLRIGYRKLQFCKLQSFGFSGVDQPARSSSGSQFNGRMNNLNHSTRAEWKSTESSPFEPKLWLPAKLEIPKQLRFWEANEQWKREISALKTNPVAPQEKECSDFEEELLFSEHTVDAQTARGYLSPAAINTIEQFSRLNGMTGKKMRSNFEATASVSVQNDAKNLVEFCVFRYLVRSGADVHPSLWDAAFRRLTFTAMLAWQRPYQEDLRSLNNASNRSKLPRGLVGEEAFVRIASSIPGAADRVTAHRLYRVLSRNMKGLSFEVWDTYIKELCGVLDERKLYQRTEASTLGLEPGETILSVGKNKRQPVQKWNGTMVWPGRLTLTDRALYFEANSLTSHQAPVRLDLTRGDAIVHKKRVGPFGAEVFDSAISVASKPDSEPWILEFVDFGGEKRRDTWLAIVKEIDTAYWFIGTYGPKDKDPSLKYMDGSKLGRKRALASASNSIARLQAVQHMLGQSSEDPSSLLQFYSIKDAPSAELVFETLAVTNWAGRMDSRAKELAVSNGVGEETPGAGQNAMGEDGSIYLSKWMTAPTWNSTKSQNFWKAYKGGISRGLVLGKNYVVGGLTNLDRAVRAWQEQSRVIDKTKATIDGAKLKGIPNNVDLLKELMLPFSIIAVNFQKLKRWEEPGVTAGFLIAAMGVVYMNWLRYLFPTMLLTCAGILVALRGLKVQGRLGDDFGKLTIRDQPETNTIQKIMALKDALTSLEDFLQKANIALLKLRTVALSRHLDSTNEVLWSLLAAGIVSWFVPFRYLLAAVLVDQFTADLPFRRKSVEEFFNRVNDWWSMIPATPVEVLPPENTSNTTDAHLPESNQGEAVLQALSEWLGDDQ
ncbi:uncharacterized protein [Physcomitrium patens]|uniref:Uncharacterized protein n=3 Tax=Physcomitrium patens TaxID=3218 RepID=A0A2K1J4Q1_PHYPA|nr:uncharacterized protein LOC112294794 [Physcomitrium patens]PNR36507.1 hypothetical protein PHYPA_022358 [Physcomitrium patens]|eukprot:XP_024401404.1 uncharacterized protein LOC112294794 [Physcomitrella patens]